jgi:hypothetical protein
MSLPFVGIMRVTGTLKKIIEDPAGIHGLPLLVVRIKNFVPKI